MNERIKELMEQAKRPLGELHPKMANTGAKWDMVLDPEKFAELIRENMRRKVIASILITDVLMEEKGKVPTSEDYIRAINKDFGIEE